MMCMKLNRLVYGLSSMLHLSEFVWIIRTSVLVVFNNIFLFDATDRSKISSDQKRIKPYTLFHFSRTLPLIVFSNENISVLSLVVCFSLIGCYSFSDDYSFSYTFKIILQDYVNLEIIKKERIKH